MSGIEIGIYSMGDYFPGSLDQHKIEPAQRVQQMIEMAQLAEQAGFDIFQVGEAHQPHFVSQSHLVILGAVAQATQKMRLGSSATIVGLQDPVRVYEDAATIDLISNGRMELVCGRGSRIGMFEILGASLEEYEASFSEKFRLLHLLNQREFITWEGEYRAGLDNVQVLPRSLQKEGIPLWYAVSGSIESVETAAIQNINIYVTNESGRLDRVETLVDHYRQVTKREGHQANKLTLASYLGVNEDSQKVIDLYGRHVKAGNEAIFGYPYDEAIFSKAPQLRSIINAGDPSLIIEKLLYQHERLAFNRYVGQIDFGGLPFQQVMKTIDLMGEFVIPQVKKHIR